MKTKARLLERLTLLMLALCLTAACDEKNEDEPVGPDNPSGPTTPTGNEFTVKTTGGTVEKGDIAITFPSGTFASETKVYVTEVAKGEIRGEDEVSTFYQVMMPTVSHCPTTVSIKSDLSDDDIIMVAHGLASSLSGETNYVDFPLDATYKDGAYTAELPIFDNNEDATYLGTITFGLTRSASAKKAASRRSDQTRLKDNGTFVFNFDWGSRETARENMELQERIESCLNEAVRIINGLGIKVEGDRKVPIIIQKDKDHGGYTLNPDEYGRYEIGQWSRKHGYILINDGFRSQEQPQKYNTETLRKTVIHELFHYFQTDYDPRSDFWKGGYFVGDMNGEYLMLYESGGVWIEKLMCNGTFSTSFILEPERAPAALRGLCNVVSGNNQALGYGQSVFVEYMTKQKGDKAVKTLLETWNKNSGSTALDIYKAWAKEIGVNLFNISVGMDNYNDFLKATATQQVVPNFGFSGIIGAERNNDDKKQVNKDGVSTYQGNVYPYGGRFAQYLIWNYSNDKGENSLKGKQLVFKETKKGVRTMVYYYKNRQFVHVGTFWESADLKITDEATLQTFRSSSSLGNCFVYMLTYSDDNAKTYPSEITVTLGDADKLELKPDSLTFGAEAGTQNVTADTNIDDISLESSDKSWLSATYDKASKTIAVSVTENKGESKRNGTITVTAKNGNNTIEKKITVEQAAGVLKNFINVRSIELRFRCNEDYWGGKIAYTSFDYDGYYYDSRYSGSFEEISSTREGDYQIITVSHHQNTFETGGSDENLSFTMKIDKDLNGEGTFSVTRKSWAQAGSGPSTSVPSTCNMSMSGSFGPEKVDKTYSWAGVLSYNEPPKSFSFSVGGFTAYFEPDNHLDVFNYSTSSTNATCSIVVRF